MRRDQCEVMASPGVPAVLGAPTELIPPGSLPAKAAAWAQARLPGIVLCGVIALAAFGIQGVEIRLFGRAWLEPLVLAILTGAAVRALQPPSERLRPGVEFCGKLLLEGAVALLGASMSVATLAGAGPQLILGVFLVVGLSIPLGYGVGRLVGLPHCMALLIACGNSICGNSAIAAVAPVIRADPKDVIAAIGFTAVLGVAVVLGLPVLSAAAGLTPRTFGVLAGLTVYAVPQVLAATAGAGAIASQLGALVKLMRVLTLGPVVLALSLAGGSRPGGAKVAITRLVPWFILAFLLLMGLRSLGVITPAAAAPLAGTAQTLTVLSMAALGLGVDVRAIRAAGPRAIAAVTVSLALLGGLAFALITLLAIR